MLTERIEILSHRSRPKKRILDETKTELRAEVSSQIDEIEEVDETCLRHNTQSGSKSVESYALKVEPVD